MLRSLLALTAALTLALPAQAQQTRVGLGVSVSPTFTLGDDTSALDSFFGPSIYLPITFQGFRLEPQFGFYRASTDGDDFESSLSSARLGTGLFFTSGGATERSTPEAASASSCRRGRSTLASSATTMRPARISSWAR